MKKNVKVNYLLAYKSKQKREKKNVRGRKKKEKIRRKRRTKRNICIQIYIEQKMKSNHLLLEKQIS